MSKPIKILTGFIFCLALMLVFGTADASDSQSAASMLQPADAYVVGQVGRYITEYNSYMEVDTATHFTEGGYYPWISIGTQGEGGVTFFNGTIINETVNEAGEPQAVTIGDDLRVDGMIFRDRLGVHEDNRPVLFGDSVAPALDNINYMGSQNLQWSEVWTYNLQGLENVHETNLAVNNGPTRNYVLAFDENNRFMWVDVADHDTLSGLTCDPGEVPSWSGSAWVCSTITPGTNYWSRNSAVGYLYPTTTSDDVMTEDYMYFNNDTDAYIRYSGTHPTGNFVISDDLIPSVNDTYNLGSDSSRWQSVYVGPEAGGIDISTIFIGASGDESAIAYFPSNDSLQFHNSADSAIGYQFFDSDGGTPILNIDTTNERVGINDSSPDFALDVENDFSANSINVNDAYTLPTADGTNGYALVTNGAGTVSWQPVASSANTLDEAYDEGGAGAGRTITVDSGAVQLQGSNAADETLEINQSTNTNVVDILAANTGFSNTILRVASNTTAAGSYNFIEFVSDNSGTPDTEFSVDEDGEIYTDDGLNVDNVLSITSDPIIESTGHLSINSGTSAGQDVAINSTDLVIEGDTSEVGVGTSDPISGFHVEDGLYAQFENNGTTDPPSSDCDSDDEIGRIYIGIGTGGNNDNELFVCTGVSGTYTGWDTVTLND